MLVVGQGIDGWQAGELSKLLDIGLGNLYASRRQRYEVSSRARAAPSFAAAQTASSRARAPSA